jgi:hypothetical protein
MTVISCNAVSTDYLGASLTQQVCYANLTPIPASLTALPFEEQVACG